jgi:sulfatase-modifying factor enzyme 1
MRKQLTTVGIVAFCVAACSAHPPTQEKMSPPMVVTTLASLEVIGPCPEGMVLVEGEYCPEAEEVCLRWVDAHGVASKEAVPTGGQTGRCGEFKRPTRCLSKHTVRKQFCIDRFEYPNVEGQVPTSWMSWHDVKNACEAEGKRLCTHSEWTFACEGPQMQPYPYGDGYHRDTTSCNTDRAGHGIDVFKATSHSTSTARQLDEMLVPSGQLRSCVSPFGTHDQVGNIDEFVVNESGWPFKSGLVGGHLFGVRNACRPQTEGHNEQFSWYETGGRCCSSMN